MNLFNVADITIENGAEKLKGEFQTPPEICRYMASMVPEEAKRVLEPTPGLGNLVTALEDKGLEVTAPKDFFLLEKSKWDAVIMNPPFSTKSCIVKNSPVGENIMGMRVGYYMLQECMKMADSIIALMPWFTIADSDVRLRFLKDFGLKSITALPRSTFQYARIQTVVIELQKGYQNTTLFHVYERLNPTTHQ